MTSCFDRAPQLYVRFPLWLPLATLLLAVAHLSFEHFSGGVQSHHLLNDAELPAISNWFELIVLPLLGVLLGLSCRRQPADAPRWAGVPLSMLPGLLGAAAYGAVLAIAFAFGAMAITEMAFFGLFLCALLFKLYQAQFVVGFVLAMTFTFGGILPLIFAAVFATTSWLLHSCITAVVSVWRKRQAVSVSQR